MGSIVSQGENLILTIPKYLVSKKEIQKILELLNFYDLVKSSELTENKAGQFSEEIKKVWRETNKNRIFAKINE